MTLEIDPDVHAAAAYLQRNFPAAKLVPIAEAISSLAPILWGRYGREIVEPAVITLATLPVEQAPEAASQ
jgi:hypothetical protein